MQAKKRKEKRRSSRDLPSKRAISGGRSLYFGSRRRGAAEPGTVLVYEGHVRSAILSNAWVVSRVAITRLRGAILNLRLDSWRVMVKGSGLFLRGVGESSWIRLPRGSVIRIVDKISNSHINGSRWIRLDQD